MFIGSINMIFLDPLGKIIHQRIHLPMQGIQRDACWIPRLGRSLGGGNGNPLQYSCLENSTDRGAWQDVVQGLAKRHDWTHIHYTYALIFYNFTVICLAGDFFTWIMLELCRTSWIYVSFFRFWKFLAVMFSRIAFSHSPSSFWAPVTCILTFWAWFICSLCSPNPYFSSVCIGLYISFWLFITCHVFCQSQSALRSIQ